MFVDIGTYPVQLLFDGKPGQAQKDYGTILQGKSRIVSDKMQMSVKDITLWCSNVQYRVPA